MQDKIKEFFKGVGPQLKELFRFRKNPEAITKTLLIVEGLFLGFITLLGTMIGYMRSYNRFMKPQGRRPDLYALPPIVKIAMVLGAVVLWVGIYLLLKLLAPILRFALSSDTFTIGFLIGFAFINIIGISLSFLFFSRWRTGMINLSLETEKFGTARFAHHEELDEYENKQGIYIGGGYVFDDKGHLLTVAGTRGGKGTNLIIPNLLGVGGYQGSWVVIDPKAENAAITARYQREIGNKVVVLNPWGLLEDRIGEAQSYNPLDILLDKSNIHLIDDVQVVAEMIVPISKGNHDNFFTDNARAVIAGLLLYLVTEQESPTLKTLWEWVRYSKDDWMNLLADMGSSDHPIYGEAVCNAANTIIRLQDAGDRTFGSIIATVLQCTDFLKSPSLQKSLESGFDPTELAEGNVTMYVIIPADKLQSHARWMRLITITTLRAVVRKPKNRVTFLLDEFAALGYLPEIENALSTYAGYNITVWPILQSLIQLYAIYHDIWETFIANATIRHFFSVNDNYTAQYISMALGESSNVTYVRHWWGVSDPQSNPRPLATPDEIRRFSAEYIFAFFGGKPPTYFMKNPYYQMIEMIDGTALRYDENPYIDLNK